MALAFAGAGREDLLDASLHAAQVAVRFRPLSQDEAAQQEEEAKLPGTSAFSTAAPGSAEKAADEEQEEQPFAFARAATEHLALPACRVSSENGLRLAL